MELKISPHSNKLIFSQVEHQMIFCPVGNANPSGFISVGLIFPTTGQFRDCTQFRISGDLAPVKEPFAITVRRGNKK